MWENLSMAPEYHKQNLLSILQKMEIRRGQIAMCDSVGLLTIRACQMMPDVVELLRRATKWQKEHQEKLRVILNGS